MENNSRSHPVASGNFRETPRGTLSSFSFQLIEFTELVGGEGGIRTHGGVTPTPVFETGLFNRSSTSPNEADKGTILRDQKQFAAALVVYCLGLLRCYWLAGIELLY
jgi:hypothetical protein